ncbi:MAG: SpoIID/LytB domain-containing protein [Clostridiales bacterium]|nr:SpoIID/LytB domain-containing protein [Clostridiales bacterium]
MKQKVKEIAVLLLFCILLPYALAMVTGKAGRGGEEAETGGIYVTETSLRGTKKISTEEYLVGGMAASISPEFEMETLKAQAVVLRTNLYEAYVREGNKAERAVEGEKVGQPYLTPCQMQTLWGADYEKWKERCTQAVRETTGEIMTYEGIPVKAPYFYVSAGRTREGAEAFPGESYPYLTAVECRQDMLCPEFSVRYTYSARILEEKLQEFWNSRGSSVAEAELSDWELTRDGSGYVVQITEPGSGKSCSGEAVREFLDLPSSCFEWEKEKNKIKITVKGKGHGIGMSQFGANELAKQGKDYRTILNVFFVEFRYKKMNKAS